MIFKNARERKVWWDVEIPVPKDRGVELSPTSWFFELLDDEGLKELLGSLDQIPMIAKRIHGWEHITSDDGTPLPFNEENKLALLRELYIQRSVGEGLIAASRGAAAKNSRPGLGG